MCLIYVERSFLYCCGNRKSVAFGLHVCFDEAVLQPEYYSLKQPAFDKAQMLKQSSSPDPTAPSWSLSLLRKV